MSKFKKNIGIQNIPLFIEKLSNILEVLIDSRNRIKLVLTIFIGHLAERLLT